MRKSCRRAAIALSLSLSLLLPAGAAHAQASAEDKAAARALATQGADALKNNKFSEAVDLVTRAEAIVHAPTHLLMIARSYVGLGKLVAAQEAYLKLIREDLADTAPAAFKNAQQTGKEELAAIEPRIASLRITIEGPGMKKASTIKLDDQPVSAALVGVFRPVDPGKHDVTAYPTGGSPVKVQVELKDGEKKDAKLFIPEGPPGSGVPVNPVDNPDAGKPPVDTRKDTGGGGFITPLRGAAFGVGGVGVAGVVVGAIFLAQGFSQASHASDVAKNMFHCDLSCPPSSKAVLQPLDDAAAQKKTVGVGILAAGGVALAGGVVLFIVGKPKPAAAPPAKAFVEPWFAGNMGGLRGQF
jgi:hypothetical protein